MSVKSLNSNVHSQRMGRKAWHEGAGDQGFRAGGLLQAVVEGEQCGVRRNRWREYLRV